ncbi:MAG: serine/threonine protein kinase [Lachnospiraceae bacterium]|nr:serine/threonine protein kinase [Lachnospiraceae bacterium]
MEEKYHKIKKLGEGATAEVWLAKECATDSLFAVKVSEQEELLAMEAQILERINHRAFPKVKEYVGQKKALVMEYVDGHSLQEILDRGQEFKLREILYIMEEVLEALNILHMQAEPIIYRDIKPANIMVERSGRIRLVDFGAAYISGRNRDEETKMRQAGTYGYGAPEQFWVGVVPSVRCDVYGAGKVLAYLLSGKNPAIPPYNMEQYCKGSRRVPLAFQRILERSLATDPLARYEDCISMRRDLHKAYEECSKRSLFKLHKKSSVNYKKCIWLSEYRRIF